jgi:hypothetical protein
VSGFTGLLVVIIHSKGDHDHRKRRDEKLLQLLQPNPYSDATKADLIVFLPWNEELMVKRILDTWYDSLVTAHLIPQNGLSSSDR